MTHDETRALLITRRDLTGESFNDGTIDAWHTALERFDRVDCRLALSEAAQRTDHVHIRDMIEQLPKREPEPEPIPTRCELCGGDGWRSINGREAHNPRTCRSNEFDEPPPAPDALVLCYCSAVRPCLCSNGQRNVETFERINEHNARELRRLGID